MELYHNGFKVLGMCSMDNISDFNAMSSELKNEYGYSKVFFDRDYAARRIIWLLK